MIKSADTGDGRNGAIDERVVRELIQWVGDSTDYDMATALREPPDIRFCHSGEIIQYEGRDIVVDASMRAAYDLVNREVYLVIPWDMADMRDRSSLLHELIHDVQFRQRKWNCIEEAEWEAYKLQDKWLGEQGFDWLRIQMLSTCPRDIHP